MSDQVQHEAEFEEVSLGRYLAIAAVVAVLVAVGAFFAGRASGGSSGPATLAAAVTQARAGKLPCGASASQPGDFLVTAVCDRNAPTRFRGGGGLRFGGPGAVTGRLTAVDGATLTVQGRAGTQKVKLGSGATIRHYATGSRGDLKAGENVVVSGTGGRQTVTVLPEAAGGPAALPAGGQ